MKHLILFKKLLLTKLNIVIELTDWAWISLLTITAMYFMFNGLGNFLKIGQIILTLVILFNVVKWYLKALNDEIKSNNEIEKLEEIIESYKLAEIKNSLDADGEETNLDAEEVLSIDEGITEIKEAA